MINKEFKYYDYRLYDTYYCRINNEIITFEFHRNGRQAKTWTLDCKQIQQEIKRSIASQTKDNVLAWIVAYKNILTLETIVSSSRSGYDINMNLCKYILNMLDNLDIEHLTIMITTVLMYIAEHSIYFREKTPTEKQIIYQIFEELFRLDPYKILFRFDERIFPLISTKEFEYEFIDITSYEEDCPTKTEYHKKRVEPSIENYYSGVLYSDRYLVRYKNKKGDNYISERYGDNNRVFITESDLKQHLEDKKEVDDYKYLLLIDKFWKHTINDIILQSMIDEYYNEFRKNGVPFKDVVLNKEQCIERVCNTILEEYCNGTELIRKIDSIINCDFERCPKPESRRKVKPVQQEETKTDKPVQTKETKTDSSEIKWNAEV